MPGLSQGTDRIILQDTGKRLNLRKEAIMDTILSLFGIGAAVDPTTFIIVSALFAVSEALSLIPAVKSNGIFQLVFNVIKKVAGKT